MTLRWFKKASECISLENLRTYSISALAKIPLAVLIGHTHVPADEANNLIGRTKASIAPPVGHVDVPNGHTNIPRGHSSY